jgi:hypothetical protein
MRFKVGYRIGLALGAVILAVLALRAKGNDWGPR